jgi:uncharacterized protein YukJ
MRDPIIEGKLCASLQMDPLEQYVGKVNYGLSKQKNEIKLRSMVEKIKVNYPRFRGLPLSKHGELSLEDTPLFIKPLYPLHNDFI